MTINPIIPIPVMAVICILFLCFKRRGWFPFIRQIVMVLLLFLINLRIMIPNDEVEVRTREIEANVLFVIDDTISMQARDYDDGEKKDAIRLDGVKKDCEYIVDRMTGSRFAVVSFHNISQILCPYSKETDFIKSTIEAIQPIDAYSASGSSLEVCKDNMLNMLRQGEKLNSGYNVIFFISDGEDNVTSQTGSFAEAEQYISNGAVLGYGSEKGGNMYVREYDEAQETILEYYNEDNYAYEPAVSRLDEKNLNDIASDLGVEYIHMTDRTKLDKIIEDVLDHVSSTTKQEHEQGYNETYYYFAIALFGMLVLEFFLLHKKIRENRIS